MHGMAGKEPGACLGRLYNQFCMLRQVGRSEYFQGDMTTSTFGPPLFSTNMIRMLNLVNEREISPSKTDRVRWDRIRVLILLSMINSVNTKNKK